MKLADTTGRWIGQDFRQYDCLTFCYLFLKDLGLNPPDHVGDWSMDNYTELVDDDIKKAQRVMIKSFLKVGRPAPKKYPSIGDLLVIKQKDAVFFPAVYVGAGKAMASFIKKGVMVFRIDTANQVALARRLS